MVHGAQLNLISDKVYHRQRTVMGLAQILQGDACLCSAKECFHVLVVGEVEHGRTVTLGVFISAANVQKSETEGPSLRESRGLL
jgi:hypothetical protein